MIISHTSNAEGVSWIPGQGIKILQATWYSQKERKKRTVINFATCYRVKIGWGLSGAHWSWHGGGS